AAGVESPRRPPTSVATIHNAGIFNSHTRNCGFQRPAQLPTSEVCDIQSYAPGSRKMPICRPPRIPSSEITPQSVWIRRREFLASAAAAGFSILAPSIAGAAPLEAAKSKYTVPEKLTPKEAVTTYNNFYEFGVGKSDPSQNSGDFKPLPWTVKVDGMVAKPKTFGFEDIMKAFPVEERVYRMRCVEAW